MKNALKIFRFRQNGFTAVETLVAVAIVGLLAVGMAAIISQTFQQSQRTNERVQAIEQVENVAAWINRDALMAQSLTAGASAGFPLTLNWQGLNGNINQVTYSLSGTSIQRSISVNGGAPSISAIARNLDVDAAKTSCSYDPSGVLTFQVTSKIGMANESRTYEVKLRVDQPSS